MKDKIYEFLKNKKILILGLGKEGKSTYRFLRSYDKNMVIGIADLKEITDEEILNDSNVILHCGEKYLAACLDYDVVIKGPGVIIKDYLDQETKKKITCQTDLFIQFATNKTIGITGTKGKSTTASLLYHILKELGKKTILMGNIGIPCFDTFDEIEEDTILVLELGCHQLEYMKHSPNISVVLDVYEEHLDHYVSMQAYVDAKKNIYKYQQSGDYVLLGDSPYLEDISDVRGRLLRAKENSDMCFFMTDNELHFIFQGKNNVIPKERIITKLKGDHNLYNILVCLTIIHILGYDVYQAIDTIQSFTGLHHRLELVGEFNNIVFYDDSIATSIPSVIFAVEALKNVDTIIVGGMDRGLDYQSLVEFLNNSSVSNILLLPATNARIKKLFEDRETTKNVIIVKDMEEAVSLAKKLTKPKMSCLLSPAAASYGFYKNFEERGDHFKELVQK